MKNSLEDVVSSFKINKGTNQNSVKNQLIVKNPLSL
jgi:hypothetical protein